jgi:hypothetical protein
MRLQSDEMKCKHCQYSEFRIDSILLWCTKKEKHATALCESFVREPGTEGDE